MNPDEYLYPTWGEGRKCHNWKNYICEDLQLIWDTFSDCQKLKIAENAQNIADREEWE